MFTTTRTALLTVIAALGFSLHAATPEQEKTFVDSYKKALEAKDAATLKGFLHTDGASAEIVEFFTMMQSMNAGQKITSIELVTPTKEELAKFGEVLPMPDGKKYKLPVAPTKVLVVATEEKSEGGSSNGSHRIPIAEIKGKLGIPVPVPAK
jgi:hypothetical protein